MIIMIPCSPIVNIKCIPRNAGLFLFFSESLKVKNFQSSPKNKKSCKKAGLHLIHSAETEGFEPSLPCGKHAFQACSFGHSDKSPLTSKCKYLNLKIFKIYSFLPKRLLLLKSNYRFDLK